MIFPLWSEWVTGKNFNSGLDMRCPEIESISEPEGKWGELRLFLVRVGGMGNNWTQLRGWNGEKDSVGYRLDEPDG